MLEKENQELKSKLKSAEEKSGWLNHTVDYLEKEYVKICSKIHKCSVTQGISAGASILSAFFLIESDDFLTKFSGGSVFHEPTGQVLFTIFSAGLAACLGLGIYKTIQEKKLFDKDEKIKISSAKLDKNNEYAKDLQGQIAENNKKINLQNQLSQSFDVILKDYYSPKIKNSVNNDLFKNDVDTKEKLDSQKPQLKDLKNQQWQKDFNDFQDKVFAVPEPIKPSNLQKEISFDIDPQQ